MVFEKIRGIICDQLDVKESAVKMESNLMDDLGADSLDLIDLVMSIEDEFDVEIPDSAIENIKTIADTVKFIEDNR
ncbi:MAG: acyl carrier protein [Clostridia bacterium]|nr:acyl carrier protein [Clostridia bacterium]